MKQHSRENYLISPKGEEEPTFEEYVTIKGSSSIEPSLNLEEYGRGGGGLASGRPRGNYEISALPPNKEDFPKLRKLLLFGSYPATMED